MRVLVWTLFISAIGCASLTYVQPEDYEEDDLADLGIPASVLSPKPKATPIPKKQK